MKTWILLLISVLGITIFTNLPSSFGDNYESFPVRINHSPVICALEPAPDPKFPDIGKKALEETGYAVLDWKTKLNGVNGKHPMWDLTSISVPLYKQNNFDYTKCDITIAFLPYPNKPIEELSAVGITIPNLELQKSRIEIYYLGVEAEVKKISWTEGYTTYYYYKYEMHYTGFLASDPQLQGTIRHEIGHALGLGHYVVSDQERDMVVHGQEDMPSIMIPIETVMGVTHFDITPLDVLQIKSIYGEKGFGPSAKTDFKKIGIVSLDKSVYLPKDKIGLSINTTNIPNDQYGLLQVIGPNNKLVQEEVISNQNSSTLYLDNSAYQNNEKYYVNFINFNSTAYDYTSFVISNQTIVQSITPSIATANSTSQNNSSISSPAVVSQVTMIPKWVKNTAKWWSESSITDGDFFEGMQFLIQQKILTVPDTSNSEQQSEKTIPGWVKNNAGWWADDQLSDDEFVKGIQWLVSNGIIKV